MQTANMPFSVTGLEELGITGYARAHQQLAPAELVAQTISRKEGILADNGALVISTGNFTGRSPKDRYIVRDGRTSATVNWNEFNIPISEGAFDSLYRRITRYFRGKELWVRDGSACADPAYRLTIRMITETPWANLFCYNMFLRPGPGAPSLHPDWTLIQAPGCKAIPEIHGTRQENFSVINFSRKIMIIGGSAYTGEIKKGIFSVLNYLLPLEHGVLSMHCSANMGADGQSAIFFGLSGTGKTTLSTDSERKLIGDDEHGWNGDGIFNFEGGCYAKCIDLSPKKEPEIHEAIRTGALLENVKFYPGSRSVNYSDKTLTENTRVSYPLYQLDHVQDPALGPAPKHIFFLCCDAHGVLPPVSRLTAAQAMFQFLSGYTAKIAGTEVGITEPRSTFSAGYGAPFLPLHPMMYARLLGERLKAGHTTCWLVNTGWSGGCYGTGNRIPLAVTRAIVKAALSGKLDRESFTSEGVFRLQVPASCPEVPAAMLHPRLSWNDPLAYDKMERELASAFLGNFKKFEGRTDPDIVAAAPQIPS
jgi:phosphoenolpyruvate carboxykinase (ATP)